MIAVAVGTAMHGFDPLVEAADRAAAALELDGFAQIGHGRYQPLALDWQRFVSEAELAGRFAAAEAIVCHAGMGLLGQALRAGPPVIVVPRRGRTTPANPSNDQTALALRLAELFPLRVCLEPAALLRTLDAALAEPRRPPPVLPPSNVPWLIAAFLAGGPPGSAHGGGGQAQLPPAGEHAGQDAGVDEKRRAEAGEVVGHRHLGAAREHR